MFKKFRVRPASLIIGISLAAGLALFPLWLEVRTRPASAKISSRSSTIFESRPVLPSPTPSVSSLTVDQILSLSRQFTTPRIGQFPQNETTQIILTGDVMLGRGVNFNMFRLGDYTRPFSRVGDILRQADFTVINLESQVFPGCPLAGESLLLCGNGLAYSALQYAGIDVAQLANDHALDYGQSALELSRDWLAQSSIDSTGLGKAALRTVRDTKFGFLGYNQVGSLPAVDTADPARLRQDISRLKTEVDVIVVGFHWGQEYQLQPTTAQISLAKAAVDAGADVIVGHHPHWVQGIQIYNGKPIFYSLGNFVSDQMESKETREGIAVKLNFWKNQLIEAQILPIFMNDFALPEWQPVGIGNSTLGKIERLSQTLN